MTSTSKTSAHCLPSLRRKCDVLTICVLITYLPLHSWSGSLFGFLLSTPLFHKGEILFPHRIFGIFGTVRARAVMLLVFISLRPRMLLNALWCSRSPHNRLSGKKSLVPLLRNLFYSQRICLSNIISFSRSSPIFLWLQDHSMWPLTRFSCGTFLQ